MKRLQMPAAVTAMIFLILAVLITSFQIAVYGDDQYQFYEKEYEKYGVDTALGMEMSDVMQVTDYMMAYLIGEREKLSIEINVDGAYQDFFNEQDRAHMKDVKNLFLGGLHIRTVSLAFALLILLALVVMKIDWKMLFPRAFFAGFGIFLIMTVALGLLFASDFTRYFTIFHEIFFTNDLWLFDPETDYMIRMLPEGFFADMLVRIGSVFVSALIFLLVVFGAWERCTKRRNKDS